MNIRQDIHLLKFHNSKPINFDRFRIVKHGLKIFKKEIEQIEKDISKLYLMTPLPPQELWKSGWVGFSIKTFGEENKCVDTVGWSYAITGRVGCLMFL